MAEPKTQRTKASVAAFLNAVEDDARRADAKAVLKVMRDATGLKAEMWGSAIVGFGAYPSATGDWPLVAFSPRKANLVVYIMSGFAGREGLLARLGKHKTGKACLYINRLADIDGEVLTELVRRSFAAKKQKHGV